MKVFLFVALLYQSRKRKRQEWLKEEEERDSTKQSQLKIHQSGDKVR